MTRKRKSKKPLHKRGYEVLTVADKSVNVFAGLIVILGLFVKFGPASGAPVPAITVLIPFPLVGQIDLGYFLIVLGVIVLAVFGFRIKRSRS